MSSRRRACCSALAIAAARSGRARRRRARRSNRSSVDRLRHPGRRPPRPHDHLHARRTRRSPRPPGTSSSTAPRASSATPARSSDCTVADFALDQCPPARRSGLVTISANYEGDPNYLLGTAPVYNIDAQVDDADRAASPSSCRRSTSRSDPGRGPHRLRLRPALHGLEHHPDDAAGRAPTSRSGASRPTTAHDAERFPPGQPGLARRLPGRRRHELHRQRRHRGEHHRSAPDRQPEHLHRRAAAGRRSTSRPTRTRRHLATQTADYPATTGCEQADLQPGRSTSSLTTNEADSPSGPRHRAAGADQFLGAGAVALDSCARRSSTLPDGLHDQPRRRRRPDRLHRRRRPNFGTEAPAACPDNSKIGTFEVDTPALDGPLIGSLYIGEPKPGDQYRAVHDRRRLRHPRQARRLGPARPADRPADRRRRRPAAGPVRRRSTCTSSPPTAA